MKLELKASRQALADAKKAAELFKRPDIDFQLVWVLNAAFLGIFPNLLEYDKIKLKNKSPTVKECVDDAKRKYCKQIQDAKDIRNDVLHQYEALYEGSDVFTPDVYEPGVYESRRYRREPFKGRHPARLIWEMVQLWEQILDEIEQAVRAQAQES